MPDQATVPPGGGIPEPGARGLGHARRRGAVRGSLWIACTPNHRDNGSGRSRQEVARAYYARQDKEENILAPANDQCRWLRQSGYQNVDCFFKVFELALFGGRKGG